MAADNPSQQGLRWPMRLNTPLRSRFRSVPNRRWGLIACATISLIIALLPHLNMFWGGAIPILQALVPVALIVMLLVAFILTIRRHFRIAIVLIIGALVAGLTIRYPAADNLLIVGDRTQIRVLSLNAQFSGADIQSVTNLILSEQLDIVMLMEVDDDFLTRLGVNGGLAHLPYRTTAELAAGAAGSVILSQWPLQDTGDVSDISLYAIPNSFQQPTAIVSVPLVGEIQLAAIHPYPPVWPVGWQQGLTQIGAWQRAHTQLPLIIAGDFNAGTVHPVFRTATAGLTNTATGGFARSILRFPTPTWPSNSWVPPFTAIDHILVRGLGLAPVAGQAQWRSVNIPGTDHRGVLATVWANNS